jgi:hypothetical protein
MNRVSLREDECAERREARLHDWVRQWCVAAQVFAQILGASEQGQNPIRTGSVRKTCIDEERADNLRPLGRIDAVDQNGVALAQIDGLAKDIRRASVTIPRDLE